MTDFAPGSPIRRAMPCCSTWSGNSRSRRTSRSRRHTSSRMGARTRSRRAGTHDTPRWRSLAACWNRWIGSSSRGSSATSWATSATWIPATPCTLRSWSAWWPLSRTGSCGSSSRAGGTGHSSGPTATTPPLVASWACSSAPSCSSSLGCCASSRPCSPCSCGRPAAVNGSSWADATSVEFTRNAAGLERALAALVGDTDTLEAANRGTQHLWFRNPVKPGSDRRAGLLATHPSIGARIDRLRALQGLAPLEPDVATGPASET